MLCAQAVRPGDEPVRARSGAEPLLVVLASEEARDVERIAGPARRRRLLVDLRLGGAAGDVRHALEQGPALARRLRRRGLGLGNVLAGDPAPVARRGGLRTVG